MQIKITYKGYINGIYGIYCGFKPDGLEVTEKVPVYYPYEGKVFEKDGEYYDCVILQDGESIDDYAEVERKDDEN
jgi:hypothetical protein